MIKQRDVVCEMATAICKQVRYECAGTVEFLMDINTNEFFHRSKSTYTGRTYNY